MMLDSWCDGVRWSVGWRHVFDRHSVVNEKTWVKWTLLVWVYSGYCVGMMWASIMHTFGWGRINWAKTCSPRSLPSSRIFRAFTSFLKISVANIQGSCHNFFFLLPDKLKKLQFLFVFSLNIFYHILSLVIKSIPVLWRLYAGTNASE